MSMDLYTHSSSKYNEAIGFEFVALDGAMYRVVGFVIELSNDIAYATVERIPSSTSGFSNFSLSYMEKHTDMKNYIRQKKIVKI